MATNYSYEHESRIEGVDSQTDNFASNTQNPAEDTEDAESVTSSSVESYVTSEDDVTGDMKSQDSEFTDEVVVNLEPELGLRDKHKKHRKPRHHSKQNGGTDPDPGKPRDGYCQSIFAAKVVATLVMVFCGIFVGFAAYSEAVLAQRIRNPFVSGLRLRNSYVISCSGVFLGCCIWALIIYVAYIYTR